jgi:haloacetate dehalogenase
MALDHPDRVGKLSILDGIPVIERLERCNARFAQAWWHWFFYGQPNKPERAILADPEAWYGASAARMGAEAYADFLEAIHDPETVHGMVVDYRAGLGIDRDHDAQDRALGRRIAYPVLCLWSLQDDSHELAGDMVEIWRSWASSVRGRGIDCTHHMAEEAPEELTGELLDFLAG